MLLGLSFLAFLSLSTANRDENDKFVFDIAARTTLEAGSEKSRAKVAFADISSHNALLESSTEGLQSKAGEQHKAHENAAKWSTLKASLQELGDAAEHAEQHLARKNAALIQFSEQESSANTADVQHKAKWSTLRASLEELGNAASHAENALNTKSASQSNALLQFSAKGHFTHGKQSQSQEAKASEYASKWSALKASLAELGDAAAQAEELEEESKHAKEMNHTNATTTGKGCYEINCECDLCEKKQTEYDTTEFTSKKCKAKTKPKKNSKVARDVCYDIGDDDACLSNCVNIGVVDEGTEGCDYPDC